MVEELSEIQKINKNLKNAFIPFFLASNSPRRKWILERAGLEYKAFSPVFNEDQFLENLSSVEKQGSIWMVSQKNHKDIIHEICSNLAIQKALIVWEFIKENYKNFIIFSADTLIYYNQFFLTKPSNKQEAYDMLKFLSGKTHTVITSHCIVNQEKIIITKDVMTLVTFRKLSHFDINHYLDLQESYDKAGAYAIQGEGAILIDNIVGDYLNIVGLSLNALIFLLKEIQF